MRPFSAFVFVGALSLSLGLIGITWGLPNQERSKFYPSSVEWYLQPQNASRLYETAPYESFDPDEGLILNALSNMKPSRGDFNPHHFIYPTSQIYLTGAAIKAASVIGLVELRNSKAFYVDNPDQMARMYLIGRLLAVLMAAMGVMLLYAVTERVLGDRLALLAATCLAITPLWVRDSHFMLVNVPAAVWTIACAYFSLHAAEAGRGATDYRTRLLPSSPIASLLLAGLLAGLATSTKYTAAPIVVLPVFVAWTRSRSAWKYVIPLVGLVFVVGFTLATPYAILSPREFIRDVLNDGKSNLGLVSPSLLLAQMAFSFGSWHAVLVLAGLVIIVARIRSWTYQFLGLWIVCGLAQRVVADVPFARYLILGLPPLAIAASLAVDQACRAICRKNTGWPKSWLPISVLMLLPTLAYSGEIVRLMRGTDVREVVARWIDENVPAGTGIGIAENMYFDMPPINAEKFVLSSGSLGDQGVPLGTTVTSSEGNRAVEAPIGGGSLTFSQRPSGIWAWPFKKPPADWGYTFVDITVQSLFIGPTGDTRQQGTRSRP